jgi:hypothetical protein
MIFLPFDTLPKDTPTRLQLLQDYFTEHCVSSNLIGDLWSIDLQFPDFPEYYIDPHIMEGIAWWKSDLTISEIPFAVKTNQDFQLSLNDSWTLLAWSQWLSTYVERMGFPNEIIILHVDDHDDLMSPRIWDGKFGWNDAITGENVSLLKPNSIAKAIKSGAIGIGSFIVPLLHSIQRVQIRHLCATTYSVTRKGLYSLTSNHVQDNLLNTKNKRIATKLQLCQNLSSVTTNNSTYRVTANLDEWLKDLPTDIPILLHIDMDYFNNRFNGDSDWLMHRKRYDPSYQEIALSISSMFDSLDRKKLIDKISNIAISLSPGFFPAEFWEASIAQIQYHLNK